MAGSGPRQSIDPRKSMNALRQESKVREGLESDVHKLKAELAESMTNYNYTAEQIESARHAKLPETQRTHLLAQRTAAADQEWARVQDVRKRLGMANYSLKDFENIISHMDAKDFGKNAATLA